MEKQNRPSPYRWVVLGVYMLVSTATQIQWLSHASVMRAAKVFYAGQFNPASLINIDFLAMIYMIVYIVACIPASWVIDRKGIRIGIGIGSVLTALGGLMKGVWATSFTAQVVGQTILAIAQPFVLNAITAVTVRWFPLRERGTAAGLASISQYIGFIIAMGVTPLMVVTDPARNDYGHGMDTALLVYGIGTFLAGLLAVAFIRERPANAPDAGVHEYDGLGGQVRSIMSHRDMILLTALFFIGLGIMNAVSTMEDSIAGNLGVMDSDGLIGVFMIVGGIIGAVVVPMLSDRYRKRKFFLSACIVLMIPGLIGLAFAEHLNPYSYEWKTLGSPAGSAPAIRGDVPHPAFEAGTPGTYLFGFAMRDRSGAVVDSGAVKVEVVKQGGTGVVAGAVRTFSGQMVLLSGSAKDRGVINTIYILAIASAFLFGFSVMSAGPIGFQYAAEVVHPASESISQGILLLVGQVSGIIFTAGMSMRNNAWLNAFMSFFAVLAVVTFVLTLFMKESPMIITEKEKYGED